MTLWEMSKMFKDPLSQGLTKFFASSSDLYNYLKFNDIQGQGESTSLEVGLGDVGFRGINEGYPANMGSEEPSNWPLFIAGGRLAVDRFFIKTRGQQWINRKIAARTKAAGLKMASTFFLGNNSTNRKTPNGLKTLCVGDQKISAGSTSGGDALSLSLLDDAIAQVEGETRVIFTNASMQAKVNSASRNPTIGGNINFQPQEFGERIPFYGGIPIVTIRRDNTNTEILAFDEAGAGGGSAVTCSIYVVGFGPSEDTGIYGIQNSAPVYYDVMSASPHVGKEMEWIVNPVVRANPRYCVRIYGIKNAAIVA
jgi:hypothetical protein